MVRLVERRQNHFASCEVIGAGLGQGHGPGAAHEQLDADLPFEGRHYSGRGGLRHSQFAGRLRETAAASDANESYESCMDEKRSFIQESYLY
jgi:hypothetical protein